MTQSLDRDLFIKYATLKKEIERLEAQVEFYKPEILKHLKAVDGEKPIELEGYGTFCIVNKKKFSYSQSVKNLEQQLKDTKREEEARGLDYEIQPIVMFKSLKVEN